MFRGTGKLFSKGIQVSCPISESQIKQYMLIQRRCKQTVHKIHDECVPKAKKKSKKLITAATIAAVGTTVAVITAKNDEEFREWTKENAPILDAIVKIVYEEEETYLEFLNRLHKELSEWIKEVLYNAFRGGKITGGEKSPLPASEVCEEAKKPYKPPDSAFAVKDEEHKEEGESKTGQPATRHRDLKLLEDKLGHAAQDVIQAYHATICALKEQASLIDNLEQLISKHDCKVWERFQKKVEDEKKNFAKAESGQETLDNVVNKLKSRLENDEELPEDIKWKARNNVTIVLNDVLKAKETLEKEKKRMVLAKRSWDKVRQARMHFTEELETLFPNIWLNDEKLNLPPDSLDPFIQNVLSNLQFLEKELSKLQTVRDAEVTSAIERFKVTQDSEGLVAAMVNMEGSKEKRLRQEEMQKSLLTHQAKCDKSARTALKQQAEVYADLKAEAISLKEREVERRMAQQLDERLARLHEEHKMAIAGMVGRIQGANAAVSGRGEEDKGQQERQQFWSAAQSLLSAIKPLGLALAQDKPKPLKNEITNVTKAAPKEDELVSLVLDSIPPQAVERGVETERGLRERFLTVATEARKVAAVPQGHVTLLQLFLARVQSALYIDEPIPRAELDNQPVDMDQLNNYQLIHRARYYAERGDFAQAVRYLNLLHGPSGAVAGDWVRDAVVYLETRQAAELLLAHASSSS